MPSERPWAPADREMVANVYHWNASRCQPENCPGALECCYAGDLSMGGFGAVLDALTAAGKLLPEPTETSIEWGVWWHAGDPAGIVLSAEYLAGEEHAHQRGQSRIGDYNIDSYTVLRREHRRYPDGWFTPHWTRHSGPHTKGEPDAR